MGEGMWGGLGAEERVVGAEGGILSQSPQCVQMNCLKKLKLLAASTPCH